MTKAEIVAQARPAKVEKTILQSQIFAHIIGHRGIERKGRTIREQFRICDAQFNRPRFDFWVHRLIVAPMRDALHA